VTVREEDNQLHSTIVIMSDEDSFRMRGVRPTMLNGKNWLVWKFQLEQVMRANHILDILDSFKKPMEITESDMNGRKNKKDIDHWNGLDDVDSLDISRTGAHGGACHDDIVTRTMVKTEGYLRNPSIEAGITCTALRSLRTRQSTSLSRDSF